MKNIALAVFLILFGVHLLTSPIPAWVIGWAAVVTGLIVGFYEVRKTP